MFNRMLVCLSILAICAAAACAETLKVGPGQKYTTVSKAMDAANDGDTIEIDSRGNYDGDVCFVRANDLTIKGVGPNRAKLDSKGKTAGGKGIFTISGNNITVENIEFVGARAPDNNGAGIRAQGRNLTVRNCRFYDCQDAILNGKGQVLIEYCEFADCGLSAHPYTHNLYMSNDVDRLIYRFNYSHGSKIGHLLKSRAKVNIITYNRLTDEDGTGSYVIDLPNGGTTYIIGNVLQKGPRGRNSVVITYGGEGMTNPNPALYVVNNTFINEKSNGRFIRAWSWPEDFKMIVANNIFAGKATNICNVKSATFSNNYVGDPKFVNAAQWDLHLASGSPCINAGTDLKPIDDIPLIPEFEYVHPTSKQPRKIVGTIDIGAYEAK